MAWELAERGLRVSYWYYRMASTSGQDQDAELESWGLFVPGFLGRQGLLPDLSWLCLLGREWDTDNVIN